MKSYKYPAIFEPGTTAAFIVEFPDLPGCLTQGDSLDDAYEMAKEAMTVWLEVELEKHEAPAATNISDAIKLATMPGSVVLAIEIDARSLETKSVRVNATLPAWMKAAAEQKGINISQTLQRALSTELGKVG